MPLPEDPFTDDTLPTTHFRDLNGAEQEAVLDVLEGQKLAAKLSI
jgi:hypothetical protein